MMHHARLFILPVLVGFFVIQSWNSAGAQSKVQIDEEVKVLFLGDWRDGIVVDKEKKKILVEYEWAGSSHRDVFNRQQIRRLYEVEARDFGRNWESASGNFKIDAALKDVIDDKVILIKQDLSEITVPLSKLSSRDNAYVKKIKKSYGAAVARGNIPAPVPKLPPLEDFPKNFASMTTFTGSSADLKPLGAIPSYLTSFKQAGYGFNMFRKQQELVAVIPVGGPDQLVLMTARESNWRNGQQFQSQVYWVSLKQQKVIGNVAITPEDYAVDYDPRNQMMLTFNRKKTFDDEDDPDNYTLWKMKPGDSTATPITRWRAEGTHWTSSMFGKIINERIILTKTDRQTYEAWDVIDKKGAYTLKAKSFFDAPAVLSPDRKHLILPEDGQVSVIDAKTGNLVLGAKVNDRHVSGANINSSGTKLAALTERNIYVWDLESGNSEPTVYPAPLIGSPFKSRVEWIGEEYILGESSTERILYSLPLKLPVWSYRMDVRQYFLNRDPLKNLVMNEMVFYVAQPDPFSGAIAVGAVNMPGPAVKETTSDIDRDSLMMLKPGVPVGLNIGSVSDPTRVEQWLIDKIIQNEWVYDEEAEIQIYAEMGIGESQTVQYRQIGGGGKTTSVSFRPHYAKLEIKKEDLIIWQTGTSTGPPSMITGDNIQGQLNNYQQPQLHFFEHVNIDKMIIDPKYSRGFGVSKLGLRGIEVVSTTPPGREDDPLAADQQAQEDLKKAGEGQQRGDAPGDSPNE